MSQTILTFISCVRPGQRASLEQRLAQIDQNPAENGLMPFGSIERLHFASLVVFPSQQYGDYLVFENNFDGSLSEYLDDLIDHAGAGLHEIYAFCKEYPGGAFDRHALKSYLLKKVVHPNAFHIGNVGRSVTRIRQEARLYGWIQELLDAYVRAGVLAESPPNIRAQMQAELRKSYDDAQVFEPAPRQSLVEKYAPWARIAAAVAGAIISLPITLPIGLVWLVTLLWKEARDAVWSSRTSQERLDKIGSREDQLHRVQNHMANLAPVKPGWFRRFTLRTVLWVVNLAARTSTGGTLSGIPSIHFAHWSLIDNGERLLFLSNYDGSWENYLDDFIDKASRGLTAIWGNTVEFPRTTLLALGGARDGTAFKAIARDRQVYTNVWYSAYPSLTVKQINKNSDVREYLSASKTEENDRTWLLKF